MLLTGFCTIFFGGLMSHSMTVPSDLAARLQSITSRSPEQGLWQDMQNIAADVSAAQKELSLERKKS